MADTDDEAMNEDDLLIQGREAYERCVEEHQHNYDAGLDDLKFARNDEQWPESVRKQRELDGRPCLTINKLRSFIRQVVNDARQNKPSIKVNPVDSKGDPETAEVINGLIRNIEQVSSADVAYDTANECAVSNGFGYMRVGLDYAYDDSFDMDITIDRVANPFAVFGDPNSTSVDGSDWDVAFVVDRLSKQEFKERYGTKDRVSFDDTAWADCGPDWVEGEQVLVAEWWTREEVEKTICKLSNGIVISKEDLDADEMLAPLVEQGLLTIDQERKTKSHKVTQRIMSGVEILETNDWPGKFIPIIPVYGDEFNIEGKRYFQSLIHPAKDAQRMHNYWRTTSTELVALAPRVPYIGPKGFADDDPNWDTANTVSHPYLEFSGGAAPQRQPLDTGVAAGALQEALNASDDMKAIIGLYDASLGARSNETSGRAIMARQREGDVATFHFIDNMARSIRHLGRIIIDLIPKVYDAPRVIRVIGESGQQEAKQINQQFQTQKPVMGPDGKPQQGQDGQPLMQAVMAMHDLAAGKYDLTVSTGPSFTSRREEAAMQMTEMVRAFPAIAPIIMDILARNLDWPEADEIAKRLAAMVPQQAQGGIPPELQQQMQKMGQTLQQLQQENATLKQGHALKQQANQIDAREAGIKEYQAQTDRMEALGTLTIQAQQAAQPQPPQQF